MLGYLKAHDPTPTQRCLSHSYLCGLCHTLGEEYGFIYRLFARPDLVFFNIFMDAVQGGPAPLQKRSCVLLPGIRKQGSRARTEHTRFTAAYGLYMAVEKLRDDVEDEGGLHRWLLFKIFQPGHRKARRVLAEAGYPVARGERWLQRQAELEAMPRLDLEAAAVPSAVLAGQLFAHAGQQRDARSGRLARGIGRRVGAFLFYMDSLLDLHRDRRARQYNPLLRLPAEDGTEDEDTARARAVQAATRQLGEIGPLLDALAPQDPAGLVAAVLRRGLGDKLRRYQSLDARRLQRARLRDLEPPPRHSPVAVLRRLGRGLTDRLRLVGALVLTSLAPRSPALGKMAMVLLVAAAALIPGMAQADGGVDAGSALDSGAPGEGDAPDQVACRSCQDGCGEGCELCDNTVCTGCCTAWEELNCGPICAECPCAACLYACK